MHTPRRLDGLELGLSAITPSSLDEFGSTRAADAARRPDLPPPPDERDYLDDDDISAYPDALESWELECAEAIADASDIEAPQPVHPLGNGTLETTLARLSERSPHQATAWEHKLADAVRSRERRRLATRTPARPRLCVQPIRARLPIARSRERRPGCARRTAASSRSASSDPGGGDPAGEPARRADHHLALAPRPSAVLAFAVLDAEQRGAEVEQ